MLRSVSTDRGGDESRCPGLDADAVRRRVAVRPDGRPAPGAVPAGRGGTPMRKRRSRPWSSATGRWCWASAGRYWAIGMTRRTPARPPSWSWCGEPGRSGGGIPWRAGCMAWPVAWHCGPAAMRRVGGRSSGVGWSGPDPPNRSRRPQSEPWPELYEELDRLPQPFRAAVVLCDLEGHSLRAGRGAAPLPGRDVTEPAGPGPRAAPPPATARGIAPAVALVGPAR